MDELQMDPGNPTSRPRAIKIFGWLNVIIGVAGLLSIVVMHTAIGWRSIRLHLESPYLFLPYLVALALCFVLAGSGLGLLSVRPWGRKWAIMYCGVVLALNVAEVIRVVISGEPPVPYPLFTIRLMLNLVYCGSMLFFMTRPHVKATFEQHARLLQSIRTSGKSYESGNPYQAP